MASLRSGTRKDGSTYVQVLYRLDGKQSSTSFEDVASAMKFQKLVDKFGPDKALETLDTDPEFSAMTVHEWIEHHIDHLTGLRKSSLYDYRSYLKNDIDETLGDLPLAALSRDDIARWMLGLSEKGASGKTIANKHGFLSGALNAAVRAGRIPSNPAAGQRLPTSERQEIVCLSHEDFARLLNNITDFWRPLVEFLVASGCRWGEATALKPSDIDRSKGTVRITRAWKRTYDRGGYEIGPPKTKKSVRTINVPKPTLDKLDYSNEWLFTNRAGRPVRGNGFHDRVWRPAVDRVWPSVDAGGKAICKGKRAPRPRIHDLRHTCATWMVLAGVPLPVVQAHLGHESINTTIALYSHVDRRSGEAAAEAIAQALANRSLP
ncbi:integrase [Mycobacterium sp. 852002-51971_SCH5477799-a]|uniref:tyrosine-type recombinase/integrase n=1 Tax=Mycobacterium sp. 852002-51971_SCH5477799-a TaxID=1834106 RepID=UPI0007FD9F9F|nr:site-specific integrase [Mycobacterium sp. 852002-51971_SCH5477799-a]OBF68808.1 integrase [Mycobacterium sp. 852002-51971_SCH5477799-a]